MHVRFLFESKLYPKQKYTTKVYHQYFPHDIEYRRDVCSLGFEPNPKHKSRLQLLGAYYRSQGIDFSMIFHFSFYIITFVIFRHKGILDSRWNF